jgi:type I restriction enzyme S subunit
LAKSFFTEQPYWPLNTTLYVTDFKGNDPKFIFYFLQSFDFEKFSDKSTVPGINRNHLHTEEVIIPPLLEQKSIASILSSLDDKIDLLHRQNATLEKMAETSFRQWFVEEAKEEWEIGKLADEFDFTMGASPPGESYNEEGCWYPNVSRKC